MSGFIYIHFSRDRQFDLVLSVINIKMIFAILVGVLLVLAFFLNEHLFNYWTKLGFQQHKPSFLIGNSGPLLRLKMSMGEYFQYLYNKHKGTKIVGLYMFYRPILLVLDAKLVQDIMIRDFTTFHDRPMPTDEDGDPLSGEFIRHQTI